MTKTTALLLAAVLVTLAMISLAAALVNRSAGAWAVFAAAVAGAVWLFRQDSQRAARDGKKSAVDAQARYEALAARTREPDFTLEVRGSTQLFSGIVALAIGAAIGFAALESHKHGLLMQVLGVSLSGLLVLVGALIVAGAVAAFGRPALVLRKDGFESPWYGRMPWERVDGLYLQVVRTRTSRVESLMVRIPELRALCAQFRPPMRWICRIRPASWGARVGIPLVRTSEPAEVIYRIARRLWTEKTGRDHDWNPNMSAEFNAALRQMQATTELMRTSATDPRTALANAPKVREAMERAVTSQAVVTAELRRRKRAVAWLAWTGVAVFVVYLALVAWRILR